jgi:hypothetical protein
MHYGTLVVFREKPEDLEAAVDELFKPYQDQHWDWYQIGGRWTGSLDGYDPDSDPANVETCPLCAGTGKRLDGMSVANGCNGCGGKGKRAVWPTQYKRHDGDIVPIERLTQEQIDKHFAHVVCEHGWFAGERYQPWNDNGDKFPKIELPPAEWLKKEYAGGIAVVVDCHN